MAEVSVYCLWLSDFLLPGRRILQRPRTVGRVWSFREEPRTFLDIICNMTVTWLDFLCCFKLPVFWADHPRVWLQQAEAQFALRNITADDTKYHYLVAALDQTTALRVIDILEDPPQHDKYGNLKRRLTDIFGLSRRQRADRLLDIGLQSLGDRRPSQLMDEMLALLGSHKPSMLFESIFLKF